jgi:hypothetical protein
MTSRGHSAQPAVAADPRYDLAGAGSGPPLAISSHREPADAHRSGGGLSARGQGCWSLRRRVVYTEPTSAQPPRRLSAKPLGRKLFVGRKCVMSIDGADQTGKGREADDTPRSSQ